MRKRISVFLILLFLCIIHTNNIANASLLSDGGRFNMTYVYFGETSRYTELVDNTKGSVDLVAISFFDIDENGELVLTDKYSHSFIQDMHQRGIKVVPFLSNHWNISAGRKALENRHKLAGDVVSAIELFGLDGVNVDIEGLNELDRENYVDFVRLVREKINPDKLLSVAVAANPFYIDNLWQGSYDYVKLAGYSDFFVVMTYDESWQGSMPGPVASSTFLERSINYALERVPKEKILLGIPFYGRYWKNGSSYGGYGIGLDDIEILKNRYESTEYFDETSKSPCLIVNIKPGDPTTYIFGRALLPGIYTIWYENELSLKYKLNLVQKYDLMGTSSWSLGQEIPDVWDYYSLWLNGMYFEDIIGHWAQEDIIATGQMGLIKGVAKNLFNPDGTLTRAQLAVLSARLLELPPADSDVQFEDVKGHWAAAEIEAARSHGIILGVGNNLFEPEKPVTREQMTVLADRLIKELPCNEEEDDINFSDVSPDRWSFDSIARLARHGIVNGFPDGMYYPEEVITRAQAAVLVNQIVGLMK